MTNPDDKTPAPTPNSAPSWVDEVLGSSRTAPSSAGSTDLRIPGSPSAESGPAGLGTAPSSSTPSWLDKERPQPAAPAQPAPSWVETLAASPTAPLPPSSQATYAPEPTPGSQADDWVTRATGGARNPVMPPASNLAPTSARNDWGTPDPSSPHLMTGAVSGETAQKKLIAGLLAIFLGSLGVHKFYLGQTTPGLLTLGVNIGVWILALLLGLLTLGMGLVITIPLAALISSGLGLLGLIEGLIYLTKSDADFQRDYVVGHKAWL